MDINFICIENWSLFMRSSGPVGHWRSYLDMYFSIICGMVSKEVVNFRSGSEIEGIITNIVRNGR